MKTNINQKVKKALIHYRKHHHQGGWQDIPKEIYINQLIEFLSENLFKDFPQISKFNDKQRTQFFEDNYPLIEKTANQIYSDNQIPKTIH